MKNLMRKMEALKDVSSELNEQICSRYDIKSNSMPVAGLNMAHNEIVRSLELISYYSEVLPLPRRGSLENFMKDEPETSQRIISLLRSCFVDVMSSFESCARKAVLWMPDVYGKVNNKIYLINIIERSRKLGWVESSDEVVWKKFIKLRNCIVHNNGEAQENGFLTLPSGLFWEFRVGLQSKITLSHLPESLEWLLSAYARWCDKILSSWYRVFDYSPAWAGFYTYQITSSKIVPHWGLDTWSGKGAWAWRAQPTRNSVS